MTDATTRHPYGCLVALSSYALRRCRGGNLEASPTKLPCHDRIIQLGEAPRGGVRPTGSAGSGLVRFIGEEPGSPLTFTNAFIHRSVRF